MNALLVGLVLARTIFGAPPQLPVDVRAPPECRGDPSLSVELASCLQEVPSGARVAVTLTARGSGFTAQIELQLAGQNVGTRVIELPRGTCAAAIRATALAICIALDSATLRSVLPRSAARELEAPESRERGLPDALYGPATSWRPSSVTPAPPEPIEVRLQLGSTLAVALSPEAIIGVQAGAAIGSRGWRVEATLIHLPVAHFESATANPYAKASLAVSWTGGSVAGTWRHGPWLMGAWLVAGAHGAHQEGYDGDAEAPLSPYIAAGVRGGVDVSLSQGAVPIDVGLHLDVGGALLRGRYVVETAQGLSAVWIPPAVPILIGLTLSAALF